MATYNQLPGPMSLGFKRGDSFSTVVDFDGVAFTGYALTASLTSLVTGDVVQAFTTNAIDAAAGQVSVSLTAAQSAALAVGTYGWRLDWTAPGLVRRSGLSGTVEVIA